MSNLEVRVIYKDGTCAVFQNVLYIDFDNDYVDMIARSCYACRRYRLAWKDYKAIKVVRK